MSTNVNFSAFSAEQLRFMIALADPENHKMQKELADELGVRPETLSRWKREPNFGAAIWELTFRNLESELGRVSAVLLDRALNAEMRAVRLLFEIAGKIGSQKSVSICTREHVLTAQEFANGIRNGLTEKQLQFVLDDIQKAFPDFVGGLVDGDELSARPYENRVWVAENVEASIVKIL